MLNIITKIKTPLLLLVIFLFGGGAFGQINLVPNPSFEDTVACPNNLDQINKAIGWSSYRGSPDYFNSCAAYGGFAGVPLNQFDYQQPRTGHAYGGFFTKSSFIYREYIGTQLSQPLTIGNTYFVSIFVNRVGNTSGQLKNIGTNKIGVRFSTVAYSYSNPVPIDNFAHIYTDSIISDTLNWTEIKGFFIADSAFQYLSIGNFFHDSLTSYILFDSTATAAYYFVDDITVMDSVLVKVNEYNQQMIKAFPNPARDWIVVEGRDIKSIEVFDLCGRIVVPKMTVSSLRTSVDISNLSHGIYILKVNTASNFLTEKIIYY